jgi:hypothetical protein
MTVQPLDRLAAWIEANGYQGSDPYDALNSPLGGIASRFGRWGPIVFMQLIRRSPVDLRRWLRIPAAVNPKAVGLLAHAYLDLYSSRQDERYLVKARQCLDWLEAEAVQLSCGLGWGYPFDWAARAFFVPRGTPSIVVSAIVGKAFVRAAEMLKQERYLNTARGVTRFILGALNRSTADAGICFSYTSLDHSVIYNASLLGASLLAQTARAGEMSDELLEPAYAATRFVLNNQNPDGSWCYGQAPFHRWIDGHHTGFILRDLAEIQAASGMTDIATPLERGLAFYLDNLITADGRPLFRIEQPWPADIHAGAEAILVLADANLRRSHGDQTARAITVADWMHTNLGRPDGAYGYLKYPRRTDWTAHFRWGQAWMFHALVRLELATGRGSTEKPVD